MTRQIVLTIESDGVTCVRCPLKDKLGGADWVCLAAGALGSDNIFGYLRTDDSGNPLCLPECAEGGQKRETGA